MILLVDELSHQTITSFAARFVTQSSKSALSSIDLGRKLSAVLRRHDSFDVLDDAGEHASVVVELLRAIVHSDAGSLADELVMRTLVRILKAAPAAHVIDQDMAEIGFSRLYVLQELNETGSIFDQKTTFAFVSISSNDRQLL
ncbi:hypothetical protein XI05_17705 [Bradyrhizobium sp. CCBAU 11357]|nr:hypothetical protein [Bradyrhizobium sp. CCBAU 11357]